jgi:hypothetical protein
MDPYPEPTQDPTPFFSAIKDDKKFIFFPYLFFVLIITFFAKILNFIPILQALFQKREGSGSGSGSVPLINRSGYEFCGSASGSPALILTLTPSLFKECKLRVRGVRCGVPAAGPAQWRVAQPRQGPGAQGHSSLHGLEGWTPESIE